MKKNALVIIVQVVVLLSVTVWICLSGKIQPVELRSSQTHIHMGPSKDYENDKRIMTQSELDELEVDAIALKKESDQNNWRLKIASVIIVVSCLVSLVMIFIVK